MTELDRMKNAIEREITWLNEQQKIDLMVTLDDDDKYSTAWNRGYHGAFRLAAKRMQYIIDNYREE